MVPAAGESRISLWTLRSRPEHRARRSCNPSGAQEDLVYLSPAWYLRPLTLSPDFKEAPFGSEASLEAGESTWSLLPALPHLGTSHFHSLGPSIFNL